MHWFSSLVVIHLTLNTVTGSEISKRETSLGSEVNYGITNNNSYPSNGESRFDDNKIEDNLNNSFSIQPRKGKIVRKVSGKVNSNNNRKKSKNKKTNNKNNRKRKKYKIDKKRKSKHHQTSTTRTSSIIAAKSLVTSHEVTAPTRNFNLPTSGMTDYIVNSVGHPTNYQEKQMDMSTDIGMQVTESYSTVQQTLLTDKSELDSSSTRKIVPSKGAHLRTLQQQQQTHHKSVESNDECELKSGHAHLGKSCYDGIYEDLYNEVRTVIRFLYPGFYFIIKLSSRK